MNVSFVVKKVTRIFLILVLVVGLSMLYSVFSEVIAIRDRFVALENTMSVAYESTIGVVMGPDELFSEKNLDGVTSVGVGSDSSRVATMVPLYRDGKLEYFNAYGLSKYYWDNGEELPKRLSDVVVEDAGVYHEWLYGKAGTDYRNASLSWANRSGSTYEGYGTGSARQTSAMTDNFRDFVRNVGITQGTVGYLKEKAAGSGSFKLGLYQYPVLTNMGFLGIHAYNEVTSNITQDQFTSTYHLGKRNKGYQRSRYYLTPMALGVTYVPVEVLKPVLKANLETCVRLNKVSGGTFRDGPGIQLGLGSADGMVASQVFEGGTVPLGLPGVDGMVNDGFIDYDINSLQVKVDYFGVDFGNGSGVNAHILSGVDGWLSDRVLGGSLDREQEGLNRFLTRDTSGMVSSLSTGDYRALYDNVKGQRVVARVSMRVRVYIPYRSSVMQWMSRISGAHIKSHFGVRQWGVGGNIIEDGDGLWYVYTRYVMNSRV